MPSLFVFRGNDQGLRFELSAETLGIGRDTGNQIQIHDTEVSRRHAELRRSDKTYILADLGSSNGTYINGQRITTQPLATGDQLQVGGTQLLYTAATGDTSGDVARKIEIIARQQTDEHSRIVALDEPGGR